MLKNEWENLLKSEEPGQNLGKIRQAVKSTSGLEALNEIIRGKEDMVMKWLTSEDAKSRQNTALLIGDLRGQEFLSSLWMAYKNESEYFVKPAYLWAIGKLDYQVYLEELKEQLKDLKKLELTVDNEKYIQEEIQAIAALIIEIEGVPKHIFTGWEKPYNIILLTNRNEAENVANELRELEPGTPVKAVGAGVMAKVKNLIWLKSLRTYHELLFLVPGMKKCLMDSLVVAETIMKSDLLTFLRDSHAGEAPYYFRLEMKSKQLQEEKSEFLKKLAISIEELSEQKLMNSTDDYQFEIRIIENKQGSCNLLVKLFTLKE